MFEEAPAPPIEVARPPGAGGAQPGSSAKKETAEPGPVSGRPRRMTRAPKYLEDFEVYEMNIDNGTPVGAEKTAEATASLPVLKKSYRDALIGVKALSVAKPNTKPTLQSRKCKKCWPTGHINKTDEPRKFWQYKKPGPYKGSRQLRKSGQSDEARTPIGSQQMSRPWQSVKLDQSDIGAINKSGNSRRTKRQKQKDMVKRKVKSKDDRWVITSDERGCVVDSGCTLPS